MATLVPRCIFPRGSLPNASQRPRASLCARARAQKPFDWTEFERRRDCLPEEAAITGSQAASGNEVPPFIGAAGAVKSLGANSWKVCGREVIGCGTRLIRGLGGSRKVKFDSRKMSFASWNSFREAWKLSRPMAVCRTEVVARGADPARLLHPAERWRQFRQFPVPAVPIAIERFSNYCDEHHVACVPLEYTLIPTHPRG
jgi:hypothetical protein